MILKVHEHIIRIAESDTTISENLDGGVWLWQSGVEALESNAYAEVHPLGFNDERTFNSKGTGKVNRVYSYGVAIYSVDAPRSIAARDRWIGLFRPSMDLGVVPGPGGNPGSSGGVEILDIFSPAPPLSFEHRGARAGGHVDVEEGILTGIWCLRGQESQDNVNLSKSGSPIYTESIFMWARVIMSPDVDRGGSQ